MERSVMMAASRSQGWGWDAQGVADGMFTLPERIMQPCQLESAQDCMQICSSAVREQGLGDPRKGDSQGVSAPSARAGHLFSMLSGSCLECDPLGTYGKLS